MTVAPRENVSLVVAGALSVLTGRLLFRTLIRTKLRRDVERQRRRPSADPGCLRPRRRAGDPVHPKSSVAATAGDGSPAPDRGSTLPGCRVIEALPPSQLVLAFRHRFTTGVPTFRLEPLGPYRTHLTAQTRAALPGLAGRIYRLLVIGSCGHVVAVRRLLDAIERRSIPFV